MSTRYSVIVTSYSRASTGSKIIDTLLERRLAACVQVIPMQSHYTWKGRRLRAGEKLLLIKARARDFARIERAILENHDYELPEIISLRVDRGFSGYLKWIAASTA